MSSTNLPTSGIPNNRLSIPITLLTPCSNFPSRTLPPLGSSTLDLDISNRKYKPGEKVRVRRYTSKYGWTPWKDGIVTKRLSVNILVGHHTTIYYVRTKADSGAYVLEAFGGHLIEICGPGEDTALDHQNLRNKQLLIQEQMTMLYARLPSRNTNDGAVVWTPVRFLRPMSKFLEETRMEVAYRNRLTNEITREEVTDVLPYTPSTANACRREGHIVDEAIIE